MDWTTEQAARAIGVSPHTLKGWRQKRSRVQGPPWVEASPRKIRYRKSDVLRWLEERKRTKGKS